MRRLVLGFTIGLFMLIAEGFTPAFANHQIYLPYAGQTWLASIVKSTQEFTYCFDTRAANYPNFVSQVRETNDQYLKIVGIRSREVAFSDPSCQVQHVMPDSFPCGDGAAACVTYANRPVLIYYKYTLGYTDWRSAIAHELGHALLQLHERYIDSGGTIQCGGPEIGYTVMDCGPPYTRVPMALDVQRGCVYLPAWCGYDATAPTRAFMPDGWSFEFATGIWYDSRNVARFGPCNGDHLRLDLLDTHWWREPGQSLGFDFDYGRYVAVPNC